MDIWMGKRAAFPETPLRLSHKIRTFKKIIMMKRILTFALALVMVLSLAACGSKNDGNKKNDNEVTLTAQEVLNQIKESLGDSYASDTAETEDRISGYYGLDLSQIESWAAESDSNSSLNMDCAVVLKVKDGYAKDAAAALQTSYEQVLSYARMYNMDLQCVLNARLFVSGNYVALLIEGAQGDWQASDEEQAKFAAEETVKVDDAWKAIFGSAENSISIPEDDGNSVFNMNDGLDDSDGELVVGG